MEMTKKSAKYTYNEVLKSIEEGINMWDFAKKFGISRLERFHIKEILMLCTNNNEALTEKLLEKISLNSQAYLEENAELEEIITYESISNLANNGYSLLDIMKKFGKTSAASFSSTIKNIYKKEGITEETQNKISQLLKVNAKNTKVTFIEKCEELAEVTTDSCNAKVCENTKSTQTLPNSFIYSTNENRNNDKNNGRIVIYTSDYFQHYNHNFLANELDEETTDERVIFSSTLQKYLMKKSVPVANKIKLTETINSGKMTVLMLSTAYQKEFGNDERLESDIILSQALKLKRDTGKEICIATSKKQTVLNALAFGFDVRISKFFILKNFSNITDEEKSKISSYFDYGITSNKNLIPKHCNQNSAVVLDSCVIITDSNLHREEILSDTTQLKVIPRIVLNELGTPEMFFSTIFAAKCNPSIILDFSTLLNYLVNDIAILNFAMYYQITTRKDVTIITYDKKLYIESLSYNMKAKFFPSSYMSTFVIPEESLKNEEKNVNEFETTNSDIIEVIEDAILEDEDSGIVAGDEELIDDNLDSLKTVDEFDSEEKESDEFDSSFEDLDDIESTLEVVENEIEEETNIESSNESSKDIVYKKTIQVIKMSSTKPIIMNSQKITSVKTGNDMLPVKLEGHKNYKYYPVKLGYLISFKNDPNLYRLVSLSGKNNLESVDFSKLGNAAYSKVS